MVCASLREDNPRASPVQEDNPRALARGLSSRKDAQTIQ